MIAGRASRGSSSGWQTIIADLALILFMVSISAVGPDAAPAASQVQAPTVIHAEPTAFYRPGASSPPLARWLAEQPRDLRQRLTVIARFGPQGQDAATASALALAAEARAAGWAPRIVIEPATGDDVAVVLAFDDPGASWHDACSFSAEGRTAPAGQREIACD